jgi:glycine cleavage system regulatory protein
LALALVAQDRPGIVKELTSALASVGANIENFESSIVMSSWSGVPIFQAHVGLTLPLGVSENEVREVLESISGEIMIDFEALSAPPDVAQLQPGWR